jgi:hypothetical protein
MDNLKSVVLSQLPNFFFTLSSNPMSMFGSRSMAVFVRDDDASITSLLEGKEKRCVTIQFYIRNPIAIINLRACRLRRHSLVMIGKYGR